MSLNNPDNLVSLFFQSPMKEFYDDLIDGMHEEFYWMSFHPTACTISDKGVRFLKDNYPLSVHADILNEDELQKFKDSSEIGFIRRSQEDIEKICSKFKPSQIIFKKSCKIKDLFGDDWRKGFVPSYFIETDVWDMAFVGVDYRKYDDNYIHHFQNWNHNETYSENPDQESLKTYLDKHFSPWSMDDDIHTVIIDKLNKIAYGKKIDFFNFDKKGKT